MMSKEKTLFNDFPPISTQEWIEKIEKDLKGKPYEKLIRKTPEGFEIKPFYREEDLKDVSFVNSMPGDFPFVRGKNIKENRWLVRQNINVDDINTANEKALKIRLNGVDSLGFILPENFKTDEKTIEKLLQNIRADVMELNFIGGDYLSIVKSIDALAKKYNRELDKVKGSVDYDPLGFLSLHGKFNTNKDEDFNNILKLYSAGKHLPKFRLININGHIFHNSGGGIVSELAYSLAMGADYLTFLTDKGITIDEAASKIGFHFAVGSDYFMEIAKFRAFRYLWAKVVNAYGLENSKNAQPFIHASSSLWNKTVYDPYVNMLRTTTETMSAVIAGVDSFTVMPFDNIYKQPDDFSERIARNQQLVLKEESYLGKVVDPAAGSYYIENLTKELIYHAWNLFLETDENGGYLKSFFNSYVQKRIKKEAYAKDIAVALRKHSILGVNQYPNVNEYIEKLEDESVLYPETVDLKNVDVEPLTIYRGAMAFEQLRYKTDKYSSNNKRPKVWMFTFGNLAMRRARSQFAGNFFGVAGFEIIDNNGFNSIKEGVATAEKDNPDIVVLCSSDEEYEDFALDAFNNLKDKFTVVLAGYPLNIVEKLKKEGLVNFIHVKSNVLEELKYYQKIVGINN
jgi:methylmalonyl-CoA mutase